jgi:hypothetical protein
MLSAPCPRCGRPAPLSLARPDVIACPACGFAGPPPPAIAQELRAAAHVVASLDSRQRQLTERQRRALASGGTRVAAFAVLYVLASLVFGGCAGCGAAVFGTSTAESQLGTAITVLPAIVMIASGLVCVLWIARRDRALRRACAASPPATPGHAASCRVCGGPLEAQTDRGVARCRFCSADNLISRDVMESVGAGRVVMIGSYAAAVRGAALGAAAAEGLSIVWIVLGSFFVPIATTLAVLVAMSRYNAVQTAPDDTIEYAVVEEPTESCIGQVSPGVNGGYEIRAGAKHQRTVPSKNGLTIVRASWLGGRRVRVHNCGWDGIAEDLDGTVVGVKKTFTGNDAVVKIDQCQPGKARDPKINCHEDGTWNYPIGYACGTCVPRAR